MARFYSALVHHPVLDRSGDIVTTAVTNLDVHDLSRSTRTYGGRGFFVVTPITAQRMIVERILEHWKSGPGARKLPERGEALSVCEPVHSIEASIEALTTREGRPPYVVVTSARPPDPATVVDEATILDRLATEERALLLLFGTGHGLAPSVYQLADAVLRPIRPGDGTYNHLSVRAAAAITLDRLFG